MTPQYYPWLFDDKEAWEKAIHDPRYSYEHPIEFFMGLYQQYRSSSHGQTATILPSLPLYALPPAAPYAPSAAAADTFSFNSPLASAPVAEASSEEKGDDGILSQSEIDALLAGL